MGSAPHDATFWDHADELRTTCFRIAAIIAIGFATCCACYQPLFHLLSHPLARHTTQTGTTISTPLRYDRITNPSSTSTTIAIDAKTSILASSVGAHINKNSATLAPGAYIDVVRPQQQSQLVLLSPTDGIVTTLKVSFWSALCLTAPLWLLAIMNFVIPGLQNKERRLIPAILTIAVLALAAGAAFGLCFTVPMANQYLYAFNAKIGTNLWTLQHYLDYTVMLLAANILAFEAAVAIGVLVHLDRLSAEGMSRHRRKMIVAVFVLSAILTPPDVVSQIALALPLTAFYEGAILYAKVRQRRSATRRVFAKTPRSANF